MEILVLLAEHAGETVSRDDLRSTLWDAYVSDDAIHRAIWKLRRSLDDHADLVETVSKRGYRLAVAPQVDATLPTSPAATGGGLARYVGIAISAVLLAAVMWVATRDVPTPASPPAVLDAEFLPFSSMSGYETKPDIDTTGANVVFANFPKEGEGALQWDLWIQPLGGGPARRLTRTPAHEMSPAMSPDGKRVAFTRMMEQRCEFVVLNVATGQETPVGVNCGAVHGRMDCCRMIDWVDESTVLATRRESVGEPVRIYEIELATGGVRTITDPPAQSDGDVAFALSSDRQQLAIVRQRTIEKGDLYVLDRRTGGLRRLTTTSYPISGLAWGADDRSLVFGWNRTGTSALWQIDTAGGEPWPLRTVGMNASGPTVRGDNLIYEEWKSEINLWEVDLATKAATRLVGSTRWDWRGSWSPDGEQLAFVSNRGGDAEIWLMAGNGGSPRQLTQGGRQIASAPVWSPDGEWLAVSIAGETGLDIARVEVATGVVESVVTDASDEREPQFAPDGSSIYFSSNRTGRWEIWAVELAGRRIARWTGDGGNSARAATDGIWFVRPGTPGLWHQSAIDAPARLVDATVEPAGPADWTVLRDGAGDLVFYVRWDQQHSGWLSRFDSVSGSTTDLVQLERDDGVKEVFGGAGLWVGRGGSSAVVSSVDLSHSDLWLRRPRRPNSPQQ